MPNLLDTTWWRGAIGEPELANHGSGSAGGIVDRDFNLIAHHPPTMKVRKICLPSAPGEWDQNNDVVRHGPYQKGCNDLAGASLEVLVADGGTKDGAAKT